LELHPLFVNRSAFVASQRQETNQARAYDEIHVIGTWKDTRKICWLAGCRPSEELGFCSSEREKIF
jgi:hypothetical protein